MSEGRLDKVSLIPFTFIVVYFPFGSLTVVIFKESFYNGAKASWSKPVFFNVIYFRSYCTSILQYAGFIQLYLLR